MIYDVKKLNTLKEEYLRLRKKYERLKELASIDLDLLFLSADLKNVPEVQEELNKVHELVQALMNEPEIDFEIDVLDLCLSGEQDIIINQQESSGNNQNGNIDMKMSRSDSSPNFRNDENKTSVTKIESLDQYISALTLLFAKQEVINAFRRLLGRTPMGEDDPSKAKLKTVTFGKKRRLRREVKRKDSLDPELFDNYDDIDDDDDKEDTLMRVAVDEIIQGVAIDGAITFETAQQTISSATAANTTDFNEVVATDTQSNVKNDWMFLVTKTAEEKNANIDRDILILNNSHATVTNNSQESNKRWKCEICSKEFKKKYYLQKHLFRHKKAGIPIHQSVDTPDEKKNAGLSVRTVWETLNESLICSFCGIQIDNKILLQKHLKSHEENQNGPLKCTLCGKEFNKRRNLKTHNIRVHSSKETSICHLCGKAVKCLYAHMSNVHSEKKLKNPCKICGKLFAKTSNVQRHMKTHIGERPFECSICNKAFSTDYTRKIHKRIHTGKYPHTCSVCGKGFPSPSTLRYHEKSHYEGLPSCSICSKKFTSEYMAKHHAKMHGESSNPNNGIITRYKCSSCESKFRGSIPFALHMLSLHANQLDHCLICRNGETFNSSADFKSHLTSIHLKEKPFKCSICGEAFYTYYRLHSHKALHKDKNAFTCSDCGKSYSCAVTLKVHQLSKHNLVSHQCNICGKLFTRKSNLSRHHHIHMNLKQYKCQVCGACFNHRSTLRLHCWTHSKVKRFQCDKCDHGFNDKRNFRSHIRKCHQENSTPHN